MADFINSLVPKFGNHAKLAKHYDIKRKANITAVLKHVERKATGGKVITVGVLESLILKLEGANG